MTSKVLHWRRCWLSLNNWVALWYGPLKRMIFTGFVSTANIHCCIPSIMSSMGGRHQRSLHPHPRKPPRRSFRLQKPHRRNLHQPGLRRRNLRLHRPRRRNPRQRRQPLFLLRTLNARAMDTIATQINVPRSLFAPTRVRSDSNVHRLWFTMKKSNHATGRRR